jgi:hypothetical protein
MTHHTFAGIETPLSFSYIALTFDPEVFPSRDTRAAMTAIASSPAGRDVMWRHLQDNWDNNPVPAG